MNLYELLGVQPDAADEIIRQAIAAQSSTWNKRRGMAVSLEKRREAEDILGAISEARQVLLDVERREHYDQSLRENGALQAALPPADMPASDTFVTRSCPYCSELILASAKKCRWCNEWLEGQGPPAPALSSPSHPQSTSSAPLPEASQPIATPRSGSPLTLTVLAVLGIFLIALIMLLFNRHHAGPRQVRGDAGQPASPGKSSRPSGNAVPSLLRLTPWTTLTGHSHHISAIAFSPDGKRLASGSEDRTVRLWDVGTGRVVATARDFSQPVISVAFSPDDRWLAATGWGGMLQLRDASSAQLARTLPGYSGDVNAVAFSPDGQRIAAGGCTKWNQQLLKCAASPIKVWQVATGQMIATMTGHSGGIWSLKFSPDGRYLASASDDDTARIWDPATGTQVNTLAGHSNAVWAVAFSPDSHLLASASWDHTVKLWEVPSGVLKTTLIGHPKYVNSVAFSPDGRWLASGGNDKVLKIWEVTSGRLHTNLEAHASYVMSIAFSQDGRWLAMGAYNKTIKLWKLSS